MESFQLLMSSPNLDTGLPRTMCGGSLDVHDHSSTCEMTGIYRVFQETRAGLIKTKQRYPETRKDNRNWLGVLVGFDRAIYVAPRARRP